MSAAEKEFQSLALAILTISDSRTRENDTSGDLLEKCALDAGHQIKARHIVADDRYQIRALVSQWIADSTVQVVLTTGGTGLTGRDGTPEAILPLLDKCIDGFGELFRALSYQEIGTSTLQSRCLAGVANGTVVICIPGSTDACQLAWSHIIQSQLDSRTQPCNLVQLMPRLKET